MGRMARTGTIRLLNSDRPRTCRVLGTRRWALGKKKSQEGDEKWGDFRELRVWQAAKKLAVYIYSQTAEGALARDYGLRDQLQRSAVSVCSNIAEGDGRGSDKDSVRFFFIARGSLAELISQVEIARDIGYLSNSVVDCFQEQAESVGRMLGALIKVREEKG